ncbi:MAG: 30S ribosomal protein S17 [Actinomycetota bacterium]|nr:30S ribosomal protein S17 [Actinomycetota bacterium]
MARKVFTGTIVSDKMDKTRVVAVTRLFQHPTYKKTMKKVLKFKAHDEDNRSKTGDRVTIVETRPLSKDKRWRITEVLTGGQASQEASK